VKLTPGVFNKDPTVWLYRARPVSYLLPREAPSQPCDIPISPYTFTNGKD